MAHLSPFYSDDVSRRHLSEWCAFTLSSPCVLVISSIWLVTWCCHVVVLVGVVERWREVVVIGGSGDEEEVVDDAGG